MYSVEFPMDYNPCLPSHKLKIALNSSLDLQKLRKIVLPKIHRR